jgi:hypothetical protein
MGHNRLQEECHITEEINPGKRIGSLFSTLFPQVSALPLRSVEKVVEKGMVSVLHLGYTHNNRDSPERAPSNRRVSHFFPGGFPMSMSMPRSALRHRPIAPEIQEWIITTPQRQTKTHHTERGLASLAKRMHPLLLVGLSMLITLLLLWMIGSILTWGNIQLDTLRYGFPHTTQLDYAVGHGGQPSHFTAWNLKGQISVLEIPGSDPAASHLLMGPHLFGPGADLAPVQLHFEGDSRHPELLVEVQNLMLRFHNTGTSYVPVTP